METPQKQIPGRLLAFDLVRVAALLGVIIYHAAGAYSTNTPYWYTHDGSSFLGTGIRELADVFIMPIFFFLAGYFTLSSLRKRGYWSFFKSKFWELGYIWILVVIIILPLVSWFTSVKGSGSSTGFIGNWLNWVGSIGQTSLGVATASGQLVHMHFWFISLLFVFFVAFIALYMAKNKFWGTSSRAINANKPETHSQKRILVSIMVFGLVISAVYFISLLFVPDTSWLVVNLLLQFEPSKIFVFMAFFGFGIYAYSRNWFTNGKPIGRLSIWLLTVLLGAAFWILGQDAFLNPATTTSLSPGYLSLFALVRTFFLLSVMMTLISLGLQYFNRPNRLISTVSDNSYYIYLVHIFVISVAQEVLMLWPQIPAVAKIFIVFFVSVPLSYVLARWVFRKLTLRAWVGRIISPAQIATAPVNANPGEKHVKV